MAEKDEELVKKARLLADATGRSFEDVLQDLLDDGELNESNKQKADLVTQLKEAAELITTVQSISQEVSENTVLNGGENKTEVKVETTLEGDIVDRAIESVQRKADNLKKLMATIIPLMILITGGSMEAFGVIDVFESEEDNYYPPHRCEPMWIFDDWSYITDNTISVDVDFYDSNYCGLELEGHFVVHLYLNGEQVNSKTAFVNTFVDTTWFDLNFADLEAGNYHITTEFHTIECEDGTCEHGPEWNSPHQPSFYISEGENTCEPDWWWKDEAIFDHDHNGEGYNNDLRVQATFRDLNQCNIHMNNGYFEIMVGSESRIMEVNFHNEYTINEHYLDLEAGDYYVELDYYTYDGSHWNGPEAWVTMESEPVCNLDLIHKEAELFLVNGNELEVGMIVQSNNECEGEIDFMFSLYHNNTYQSTVEYGEITPFSITRTGEYRITLSHSDWKNLGDGKWSLETRIKPTNGEEICCIQTNDVEVGANE